MCIHVVLVIIQKVSVCILDFVTSIFRSKNPKMMIFLSKKLEDNILHICTNKDHSEQGVPAGT